MSATLTALTVRHRVGRVPKDGDCFYHSVGHLMGTSSSKLRSIVAAHITQTHATLFNVINDTSMTLQQVKTLVQQPQDAWADHIEIELLTAHFQPAFCLVVVDDDRHTLTMHGTYVRCVTPIVVVQLREEHYSPITLLNDRLGYFTMNELTSSNAVVVTPDTDTAWRASFCTSRVMWMLCACVLAMCAREDALVPAWGRV